VRAIGENDSSERIFDLYYDRAPKDINHRKGGWCLYRELSAD
jgi:hypothetical protein